MQKKQNQVMVLGIDGCRSGWCVAALQSGTIEVTHKSNLNEIAGAFPDFELALIDMPIGLGDKNIDRDLDREVRKELSPLRHQSIFTPPVREAITAIDYSEAKKINHGIMGKKISIQSWNISPKIIELELFLRRNPSFQRYTFESHPELCFKYLNNGVIPSLSKSAPKNTGIEERMAILNKYNSKIRQIYGQARVQLAGSGVKNDDIVDALCLATVAKLGSIHQFQKIIGSNKTDAQGIDMAMYYYNPLLHH